MGKMSPHTKAHTNLAEGGFQAICASLGGHSGGASLWGACAREWTAALRRITELARIHVTIPCGTSCDNRPARLGRSASVICCVTGFSAQGTQSVQEVRSHATHGNEGCGRVRRNQTARLHALTPPQTRQPRCHRAKPPLCLSAGGGRSGLISCRWLALKPDERSPHSKRSTDQQPRQGNLPFPLRTLFIVKQSGRS